MTTLIFCWNDKDSKLTIFVSLQALFTNISDMIHVLRSREKDAGLQSQ